MSARSKRIGRRYEHKTAKLLNTLPIGVARRNEGSGMHKNTNIDLDGDVAWDLPDLGRLRVESKEKKKMPDWIIHATSQGDAVFFHQPNEVPQVMVSWPMFKKLVEYFYSTTQKAQE